MSDTSEPTTRRRRSILELSHTEARAYFLKGKSYCDFDLPPYIVFDSLLQNISDFLESQNLSSCRVSNPRDHENLNHVIFNNKDGKYAWRPMHLIHPAIYVSLVHAITEEQHWNTILTRLSNFSIQPKIKCLSLPGESLSNESDKAEQVSSWWLEVEQKSIELALDYEYLIQTDITDCYGALYTHSIAWSLHTKPEAKRRENRNNRDLIGVLIDQHLQDMSHGQTNGIPQGSGLMDFIAEVVLGYADQELANELNELDLEDYQILRYRDDYRIFVNNPQNGEKILKALTGVLIGLGFKLNSSKTFLSNQVIQGSIKPDKLKWMTKVKATKGLQKHLLIIHDHSIQFPNSGSLVVALSDFYKRLLRNKKPVKPLIPMISIVVDVAFHSPRTYPIVAAILSKLISLVDDEGVKRDIVCRIKKRFEQLPNTGHMQIWLQRVSLPIENTFSYDEPICKLVSNETQEIWNAEWISSRQLKELMDPNEIINRELVESLQPVVPLQEVELFVSRAYRYSGS